MIPKTPDHEDSKRGLIPSPNQRAKEEEIVANLFQVENIDEVSHTKLLKNERSEEKVAKDNKENEKLEPSNVIGNLFGGMKKEKGK